MNIHLAVTPSGRVVAVESTQEGVEPLDSSSDAVADQRLEKKIARRFVSSQAEGIFALATERMDRPNPSFAYWRDFGGRYLTELCHTPEMTGAPIEAIPPPAPAERADATRQPSIQNARPNFTPEQYRRAVARCVEYIAAGDIFQVNLSQRFTVADAPAPLALYRALRRRNPAWYAAYLAFRAEGRRCAVVSSSPELFRETSE